MDELHPITEFRKLTGTSQEDLATLVGCKRWMINRIEARKRTPSPKLAISIQDATGIDARRLLGIPMEVAR
jgi:DNA-binding XRE family transcriptional regulator